LTAARYSPRVSHLSYLPSVDLIPQRAKPFHRDGWVYEEKYDSWRIVAVKRGQPQGDGRIPKALAPTSNTRN
jgi:hypothetical protein